MNIIEYLKGLGNEKVYYKPNTGNGGDALIAAGAYKAFEKAGIEYEIIQHEERHDLTGKIVLYAGGGNLVDEYRDCANFIAKHHHKVKHLIVLPHTIKGHRDLLESLAENVTLFCREQRSFEYLDSLKINCNFYLEHDLAFLLNVNEYRYLDPKIRMLKLKRDVKYFLRKQKKTTVLNAFRLDVEKTKVEIPDDNIDVSIRFNFDPSMRSTNLVKKNVSAIFQFLSFYKVVNTNRLHIAIAGALLGKEVNFYPNSYWKNQAVYDHSLRENYPTVQFFEG